MASRRQHIFDSVLQFRKTQAEPEIDPLLAADWMMANKLWEPKRSLRKQCADEIREACHSALDENGDRMMIAVKLEQKTLWTLRWEASYPARLADLNAKIRGCRNDIAALKQYVSCLNRELKPGEPQFTLPLTWDDDELAEGAA